MKNYKFTMSDGFVGTDREDFIEFEDNVTEEEVQQAWQDWVWNFIEGGYDVVEE